MDATNTIIRLGVQKVGTTTSYHRGFLYFNTSVLPDNATVTAGTISVYLTDAWWIIPGGVEIVLMHGVAGKPSTPLAVGDFNHNLYSSGGAPNATAYNAQTGELTFTLNATGCGWVNVAGPTTFCLRTEHDVAPCNPISGLYFEIYGTEKGGGFRPCLGITYGTKATVATDAASDITPESVTGNGTIDSEGDGSSTEYGFIWNDGGSDPVDLASADNSQTSSNLSGGSFSATLAGLTPDRTYDYRAYVTTEYGTSYGDAVEFTAETLPATLTIETHATTGVDDDVFTLNGELVADGGESVTEHGFVWASGHDPMHGQTGAPTGADHYCELGTGSTGPFSHQVTGATSSALYLFRAYGTTSGGTLYGGLRHTWAEIPRKKVWTYAVTGSGQLWTEDALVPTGSLPVGPTGACAAAQGITGAEILSTGIKTHYMEAAWWESMGFYFITLERTYLYFDIASVVPTGATLISGSLHVYVHDPDPFTPRGMAVLSGQPDYPGESGGVPSLSKADLAPAEYELLKAVDGTEINLDAYNSFTPLPAGVFPTGSLAKFVVIPGVTGCEFIVGATGTAATLTISGQSADNPPYVTLTVEKLAGPAYPQANIGDTWEDVDLILANIGNEWRPITEIQANIGDEWKNVTGA